MNRRTKIVVGCLAILAVGFFLFAPVLYWFGYYPPLPYQNAPHYSVYRSLACATIGFGDTYTISGLHLTCNAPVIPQAIGY
ncbi:MAG: hypothetical protein JRN20_07870 [Nitrososphaerota archaeon]|nr:hypothetical protein [Nitrososphaerota archaeon]